MLLKQATLEGIRSGAISIAFRRWRRPTVKAGGTLLTAIGQLAIEAVDVVDPGKITSAEVTAAGFLDRATLLRELSKRPGGELYRVRLSLAGADPRLALRRTIAKGPERDELLRRMERMASRQGAGRPTEVLALIKKRPGVRAGDLARDVGMPRDLFKRRVRSLKELGLTESLEVGYRLSPRGTAILRYLLG
jgi:hypothetical protein